MLPQPIRKSELRTSAIEHTSEVYDIAKVVRLKIVQYDRKQYGVLHPSDGFGCRKSCAQVLARRFLCGRLRLLARIYRFAGFGECRLPQ